MDATEFLAADHQKVRSLFEQIQTVDHYPEKRRIFAQIKLELEVHSAVEESGFYPIFARREGFTALVEEACAEHREMKDLLEEIDAVFADVADQEQFAEQVEHKLDELIDRVERHVEAEEGSLFPRVRDTWSAVELKLVGAKLEQMKGEQLAAAAASKLDDRDQAA